MDHDRAERLIGERLDGERLARRRRDELERHLEGCAECRAFERGAWRLRERVRFEVAPAVPDLVEPIMLRRGRGLDGSARPPRRRRPASREDLAVAPCFRGSRPRSPPSSSARSSAASWSADRGPSGTGASAGRRSRPRT